MIVAPQYIDKYVAWSQSALPNSSITRGKRAPHPVQNPLKVKTDDLQRKGNTA